MAREDVVPFALLDFTPTGKPTNQLAVRANPAQRWHYYPAITGDEVFAFKNFECRKEDDPKRLAACFHAAFADPTAPTDAPMRTSCEQRVQVWLLDDA